MRVGVLVAVLLSMLGMHGLAPHAGVVHEPMQAVVAVSLHPHAEMGDHAAAPFGALDNVAPAPSTGGHHDMLHLCLAILLGLSLLMMTAWLARRRVAFADQAPVLGLGVRVLERGRAKDPPALSRLGLLRC